ncbi:MAG: hypothetical protein WB992_23185, partial [Bryobacteraceae bacterium]
MAVTRTWEGAVAVKLELAGKAKPVERRRELFWLAGASIVVASALALVFAAKTQDFPELQTRLEHGELINLNEVSGPEEIARALPMFNDPADREQVAERIWNYLQQRRPLPNVGALARLRSGAENLVPASRPRAALLALAKVKPSFVVRTPREFLRTYVFWISLYLTAFWAVHLIWRWRGFRGDAAILPAVHLLSGIGLVLMVSLRDPLRDTLEFKKFAWGVLLGCAILLLPLLRPFQYRNFSRWVYTPVLLAFALFIALLGFGSGPTGSDAKVNLGPFQPVEVIKVLPVFFMAGYFAQNWERLRDLNQRKFVPRWLRWLELPRVSHALPVMCAVGCGLILFFVLKDLGPALVAGFVFLTMFAVA